MDDLAKSVKDIELRQVKIEERQNGHEKTCDVRYEAIAEKQNATIDRIDAVKTHLEHFTSSADERLKAVENIKWALSGKVVAALIGVCIFLFSIIGWMVVNGRPWD